MGVAAAWSYRSYCSVGMWTLVKCSAYVYVYENKQQYVTHTRLLHKCHSTSEPQPYCSTERCARATTPPTQHKAPPLNVSSTNSNTALRGQHHISPSLPRPLTLRLVASGGTQLGQLALKLFGDRLLDRRRPGHLLLWRRAHSHHYAASTPAQTVSYRGKLCTQQHTTTHGGRSKQA